MNWYIANNNSSCIPVAEIPVADYVHFYMDVKEKIRNDNYHIGHYFAFPDNDSLRFVCILLNDATGEALIASHIYGYYSDHEIESLTAVSEQFHPFEREIGEMHGIKFKDNPWNKPLRFPHEHRNKFSSIDNYPFYSIDGDALHEVNVGPIHAGVIEPGAFRFICNGERVLHLEISLGYQHRGVEKLISATDNILRQSVLCESTAGDSAVAHSLAYANVIEKLSRRPNSPTLARERVMALELERIAMHIADSGALCADIGYQTGQVACEALRTVVINTTQLWCGNRFGKGLIRPGGTNFPAHGDILSDIITNIKEVTRRYAEIREDFKSTQSLLARFEDCGAVSAGQMYRIGAVGMAARSSGCIRDIRATHPFEAYSGLLPHEPVIKKQGDVMARLMLRGSEIFQSCEYVLQLADELTQQSGVSNAPAYNTAIEPRSLTFSLTEGWRGEICHVAVTGETGKIEHYKIKDPSIHNWLALALAVRGEGISDFPICNKSFNLSYCGHDL